MSLTVEIRQVNRPPYSVACEIPTSPGARTLDIQVVCEPDDEEPPEPSSYKRQALRGIALPNIEYQKDLVGSWNDLPASVIALTPAVGRPSPLPAFDQPRWDAS